MLLDQTLHAALVEEGHLLHPSLVDKRYRFVIQRWLLKLALRLAQLAQEQDRRSRRPKEGSWPWHELHTQAEPDLLELQTETELGSCYLEQLPVKAAEASWEAQDASMPEEVVLDCGTTLAHAEQQRQGLVQARLKGPHVDREATSRGTHLQGSVILEL
mmetsp:Transcript_73875/g.130509  ORF Transcript_73875/g.130509 Transcript_73875/m.130509 type:complete len:159 (+) Transcript_73875:489-965(+)